MLGVQVRGVWARASGARWVSRVAAAAVVVVPSQKLQSARPAMSAVLAARASPGFAMGSGEREQAQQTWTASGGSVGTSIRLGGAGRGGRERAVYPTNAVDDAQADDGVLDRLEARDADRHRRRRTRFVRTTARHFVIFGTRSDVCHGIFGKSAILNRLETCACSNSAAICRDLAQNTPRDNQYASSSLHILSIWRCLRRGSTTLHTYARLCKILLNFFLDGSSIRVIAHRCCPSQYVTTYRRTGDLFNAAAAAAASCLAVESMFLSI